MEVTLTLTLPLPLPLPLIRVTSMAPISRRRVLLLSLRAQASMVRAAEVAVSAEAVVRK